MKILGIESSSLVASVAIWENDSIVAEYTVNFKKTHSQTLLPMIDEIIKMTETEKNSLDAIAVSGGPGSFTGLRIGSATAKGLGLALQKPLIHVPTVDALAYQLYECGALICPIMDARRNQVYTGIYSYENGAFTVKKAQCAMDIHELITELNQMGQSVAFLGDGVPVYKAAIEAEMQVPFTFVPSFASRQRGAAVAALGAEMFVRGEYETAAEHAPDYLRLSQAEREHKAKQAVE